MKITRINRRVLMLYILLASTVSTSIIAAPSKQQTIDWINKRLPLYALKEKNASFRESKVEGCKLVIKKKIVSMRGGCGRSCKETINRRTTVPLGKVMFKTKLNFYRSPTTGTLTSAPKMLCTDGHPNCIKDSNATFAGYDSKRLASAELPIINWKWGQKISKALSHLGKICKSETDKKDNLF